MCLLYIKEVSKYEILKVFVAEASLISVMIALNMFSVRLFMTKTIKLML